MRKTATEIACAVISKVSSQYQTTGPNDFGANVTQGLGTVGGSLLGGLFGGAAGAGLGSAIRGFPGQEPTSAVGKALTKVVQNPVGKGIATALPYAGLLAGLYTGGRSGYNAFDVGDKLTNEDVQRMLDMYAQRLS
jgi:hypothetical protein